MAIFLSIIADIMLSRFLLIPALEESAAAASLLRRQVADKITASVAALNQIIDTWKRIDGPLSSALPVDPTFVKPTTPGGACAIC